MTGVPALSEELEKAKNTSVINKGQTIAWGTNRKGTPYDVVKYSDGTIIRKLRKVIPPSKIIYLNSILDF